MNNEAVDPVHSLSSDYHTSAQQVSDYQRNGHMLLRQVVSSDEMAEYRPVITNLVKELNYHNKPIHERDTYGKAFIQIGSLWKKSEAARRFVLARRFAKIAADLMGVDRVRLYHDQALFKEPGGGHTPWHQDQIYWPLDTEKTITMWMPLVPVSSEVGTMSFASGSHHAGYISKLVISDESHKTLKQYIDAKGYDIISYGGMEPGDATFHAGWTLHCAPGNPTETMREVMTIIYYADGARVLEPDSAARRGDYEALYKGVNYGDLADTPLNPIVFNREA